MTVSSIRIFTAPPLSCFRVGAASFVRLFLPMYGHLPESSVRTRWAMRTSTVKQAAWCRCLAEKSTKHLMASSRWRLFARGHRLNVSYLSERERIHASRSDSRISRWAYMRKAPCAAKLPLRASLTG